MADRPPRLLDQVRRAIRIRHYSPRTESAYLNWIVRFIRFHDVRHPKEMGAREVSEFLSHLAVEGNVAASTQNQALAALALLASFVLAPGPARFGTVGDIASSPAHEGEKVELYGTSEYCAACHTIIHPLNGIRLEHTYDEWKKSVYAEKGIQCQDCHMASVADAVEVAKTLTPKRIKGTFIPNGVEREMLQQICAAFGVEDFVAMTLPDLWSVFVHIRDGQVARLLVKS